MATAPTRLRLGAFARRSREAGDLRDADAAERLLQAATALLTLTERIPHRGRLADLLEAWRGGLDAAGFWTALEQEPLETDPRARSATAREAAAVEVWRALRPGCARRMEGREDRWPGAGSRLLRSLARRCRGDALDRGSHRPGRRCAPASARGPRRTSARLPRCRRPRCSELPPARAAIPARGRGAPGDPRRARPGRAVLAGGERGRAVPSAGGARPRPPRTCARLRRPRRRLPAPQRGRRSGRRGPAAARRDRHVGAGPLLAGNSAARRGSGARLGARAPRARGLRRSRPAERRPRPGGRGRPRRAGRSRVARGRPGPRRDRRREAPGWRRPASTRRLQRAARSRDRCARRGGGAARRHTRGSAVVHQPDGARELPVPGPLAARCSASSRRTTAPRSSMHAAADSSSTRRSSSW